MISFFSTIRFAYILAAICLVNIDISAIQLRKLSNPFASRGELKKIKRTPQKGRKTPAASIVIPPVTNTYVVTLTTDTGVPGELRWAIQQSNANPPALGQVNEIDFNIPGCGPFRIQPVSNLPGIVVPTFVNGYSQPGALKNSDPLATNANLLIEINGNAFTTGNPGIGLEIDLGGLGSIIEGLVINEWNGAGIYLNGTEGVSVGGCFVGTNVAGDASDPNSANIFASQSAFLQIGSPDIGDRNLIGGNFIGNFGLGFGIFDLLGFTNAIINNLVGCDRTGMISFIGDMGIGLVETELDTIAQNLTVGNVTSGIFLQAFCSDNVILNNLVGTNVNGTQGLPNIFGIFLVGPAVENNIIQNNQISANFTGIGLGFTNSAGVNNNLVIGNLIGTDASGKARLGNTRGGIAVINDNNIIGGTTVQARNVISANGDNGITISGNNTQILGNYIGVDITGENPLGNEKDGIQVGLSANTGAANNTIIGGTASGAGNVISANGGNGISIKSGSTGTIIQGNFIGTDATGTKPLANGRDAIFISNSSGNTIGGTQPGAGNVIAYNCEGIVVGVNACDTSNSTSILSNSIFANRGVGIDLHKKYPQVQGKGTNNGQASPVLTDAKIVSGQLKVHGKLHSLANASFLIQLFTSETHKKGQGRTLIGSATVTTNDNGYACFTASMPNEGACYLTATATQVVGEGFTNTSEFSNLIKIR